MMELAILAFLGFIFLGHEQGENEGKAHNQMKKDKK